MVGTRIGVIGCAGRMGRMLIADIVASEGCELAGGAAKPGSAAVGQDLGELAGIGRVGIAATGDARQVLRDSDVAIDFTTPDATASHAALAAELGRPIVIGDFLAPPMRRDLAATLREVLSRWRTALNPANAK